MHGVWECTVCGPGADGVEDEEDDALEDGDVEEAEHLVETRDMVPVEQGRSGEIRGDQGRCGRGRAPRRGRRSSTCVGRMHAEDWAGMGGDGRRLGGDGRRLDALRVLSVRLGPDVRVVVRRVEQLDPREEDGAHGERLHEEAPRARRQLLQPHLREGRFGLGLGLRLG